MPEYIDNALKFICPTVSNRTLRSILEFRISNDTEDRPTLINIIKKVDFNDKESIQQVINQYSEIYGDDYITHLLNQQNENLDINTPS